MKTRRSETILQYVAAVLAVGAAVGMRLLLNPFLDQRAPFVTFFVAVVFAAWYGGFGPSLLATILSALSAMVMFIPTEGFGVDGIAGWVGLATFIFVGLASAVLGEFMHVSRRQAEWQAEEIARQREHLHITLASIGDAVIATDAQGNVTFMNTVAEHLTGWLETDAAGKPVQEVFHIVNEDTRQIVENPVERVLREGKVVGLANHTVLISKGGDERPIDDSAAPIRNAEEVSGSVLIFRDVSERRQAEKALQQSEARKTAILETALDCIITIDHEGRIIEFNPAAEQTFGYRRTEVLGCEMGDLIVPPAMREQHRQGMRHFLETGEGPVLNRRLELVALHADGSEFPVELTITPIGSDDSPLFTSFLRDITERKQQEIDRAEQVRLMAFGRDVSLALTHGESLQEILQHCAEAMVENLECAFARIWTLGEGGNTLELQASAGMYTHLDGAHSRIPVGQYKIGMIAQEKKPHLTNSVLGDERVHDQEWAKEQGMTAFAGYPLLVEDRVVGVMALFSRHSLSDSTLSAMSSVANSVAIGIVRKRSEEELQEQRERLRITLASIGDAVITTDLAGRITNLNTVAESLTGWKDSEAIGMSIEQVFRVVDEQTRQPIENSATRAIREEGIASLEERAVLISRDGTERPIDDNAAPIRCRVGKVVGCVLVFRDVTEQRQAERELKQSEERNRALVAASSQVVWTADSEGLVQEDSPSWRAFTGQTSEERNGLGWLDAIYPDDRESAAQLWRESVANGTVCNTAYRLRKADGSYCWTAVRAVPVLSADGSTREWVAMNTDINVRKQAEEDRQKFVRLVEASSDFIGMATPDGKGVYLNQAGAEMVGLKDGEEVRSKTVFDFFPEDVQRLYTETVLPTVRETGLWEGEVSFKHFQTGELIPILQTLFLVRDPQTGEPTHIATVSRNISERKRSEEQLREQENQYRSIFESTSDAILVFDLDGNLKEINPAACRMHGYSYDELIGKKGTEIVHPEDHYKFEDFVRQVNAGEEFHVEGRHVRKDGALVAVQVTGTSFRFAGQPALLAIARDVTDERKAVEALKESEEKFRLMADTIPQLAWMARPDGHIFWYNSRWYEYTGKSPAEMEGWGWQSVHDPEVLPQVMQRWRASLASGEPFDMVFPIQGADGQFRPFLTRINPLQNDRGEIRCWFGTNTDISEQKRIQEELRDVAARLSEADRRKDEFLAMLAHELRNPLAPIRTGLEVMKLAKNDPETVAEIHTTMERQTQQLIMLVDDLLDVSRITRGKLELRKCRVELAEIVQSAVEASRPFIDEAAHELKVDIPQEAMPMEADPHRLAQVLSNLLNNAAKYTPEGGRIQLTAQKEGAEVVISVKDNGIGIPADMLEPIFEMFAQIDRPMEKGGTGLGIGLTLVKSLVEMHGGSVAVQSDGPNQGSEFSVRLPWLLKASQAGSQSSLADEGTSPKARRRILVVDDNKAAADMLSMVVKMLGNEVRIALDGKQAIEVAAEFRPDVVLMDLGMPRMNGYEAARHIRKQEWGKEMMLIALTGWGQEEDKRRTQEAGFDHHLVKPADPAILQDLLSQSNND